VGDEYPGVWVTEMRIAAVFALATCLAHAETSESWKKLEFLIGKWIGVAGANDTPNGAAQGAFSFEPQLSGKILVRKNNATYTSGERHDDLMIIYVDPPKDTARAIYFDTEGHVIRYDIAFPSANRVIFESDTSQPGPRFRLTYWLAGASLNGSFEVASPGS